MVSLDLITQSVEPEIMNLLRKNRLIKTSEAFEYVSSKIKEQYDNLNDADNANSAVEIIDSIIERNSLEGFFGLEDDYLTIDEAFKNPQAKNDQTNFAILYEDARCYLVETFGIIRDDNELESINEKMSEKLLDYVIFQTQDVDMKNKEWRQSKISDNILYEFSYSNSTKTSFFPKAIHTVKVKDLDKVCYHYDKALNLQ